MLSSPDGAAGELCWTKLSARGAQEHPIESMFAQLITTNHYRCCLLYTLSINLFLAITEAIIAPLVLYMCPGSRSHLRKGHKPTEYLVMCIQGLGFTLLKLSHLVSLNTQNV